VRALSNALASDRLHHAYLFTGTRGVGKTTVARVFAKCLNCESGVTAEPCGTCSSCRELDEGRFVDLIEVDAASRAKVDETRDLMDNVQFAPARGRYKVYLIDEVHMFSSHSFNALLKTLEEPPPHVKFLLATTDPQKLPVTVLSRCLQFHMRQLAPAEIVAHLAQLSQAEGLQAEAGALAVIGRAASGSMRDALSLLDQAIAHGAGDVREADVRAMLGAAHNQVPFDLLDAIGARDAAKMLHYVSAVAEAAPDFDALLGEVLLALQRVAVAQFVPERVDETDVENVARVLSLAQTLTPEDAQLFYQIGVMGRRDLPFALDPRSGFEMVLLRMLAFQPAAPASASGAAPGAASVPSRSSDSDAVAVRTHTAPSAPAAVPKTPVVPVAKVRPSAPPVPNQALPQEPSVANASMPPPDDEEPPPHGDDDWRPSQDDEAALVGSMPNGPQRASRRPARPAAPSHTEQRRNPAATRRADAPADDASRRNNTANKAARSPAQATPAVESAAVVANSAAQSFDGQVAVLTPQSWTDTVPKLGLTGLARELASNTEFVSHADGRINLRIAHQHAQLRMPRAEEALLGALCTHLQQRVRLEITPGELSSESPALAQQRKSEAAQASATAAIREDPTVQAICDMFDATVDPQGVRPRQDGIDPGASRH